MRRRETEKERKSSTPIGECNQTFEMRPTEKALRMNGQRGRGRGLSFDFVSPSVPASHITLICIKILTALCMVAS